MYRHDRCIEYFIENKRSVGLKIISHSVIDEWTQTKIDGVVDRFGFTLVTGAQVIFYASLHLQLNKTEKR